MLPTTTRLFVTIVTAAILAASPGTLHAACDVNYVGPNNGIWDSTGNWDTNAVPTNAQIACIPAGKGTIDIANGVNATAKSLQALSRLQIDAGGSLTTTDSTPNAFSDTVTDLVIVAGATFTVGNAGVAANGTVVLDGAIAGPGSIRLDGGSLRGSGMVAASLQNVGGTVQPGGPGLVGTLTVGGAFNQGVGGTLEIDLASDSSFDKIHGPTFNHYVDGTIVVTLLGGYLPTVGTTWDFIPPDGFGTTVPAAVTPPEFIAHPISMGATIELSSSLSNTTTTTLPTCGNGTIDGDEECDGPAFEIACPDVKDDSSCRRCTTGCTLDCSLCAATTVDAFILPSALVLKLNASTPEKSKLVAGGIFDTGPAAADLGASATFHVGGLTVTGAAPAREAGGFVLKDTGLLFKVVPAKTGSSKAKFKLKVQRDLTGLVDPDAPLTMEFTNPTVDGIGTVRLTGGKYRLRKKPGDLIAPALFLVSVRTHLAGSGKDSLTMRLGFAGDSGQVPASAPDVTVAFGPTFAASIPGSALAAKGNGFAGSAGGVQVTIDYKRELVTVRAKKVDLGTFTDGAQAVLVAAGLDGDTRANEVRMVKKGKAIRY